MNLNKTFLLLIFVSLAYSCADYKVNKKSESKAKQYYSLSGFALVYEDNLYMQKVINKKINNEDIRAMHDLLRINTPIKVINPANLKFIETKIYRRAKYPKIFNIVISQKIASILELDLNNPYVEIIEIKKNKTFVAKKTNTLDEEKNVVGKVPIDKIEMDDLTNTKTAIEKKISKSNNFTLLINDFYYQDSAINLKNKLIKKTKMNNITVKKINDKKYRLLVGPFKNFNALKIAYISLNNLGFEHLNIQKN